MFINLDRLKIRENKRPVIYRTLKTFEVVERTLLVSEGLDFHGATKHGMGWDVIVLVVLSYHMMLANTDGVYRSKAKNPPPPPRAFETRDCSL